jgi:type II secretory pathway component GspD/PulD (secretin)
LVGTLWLGASLAVAQPVGELATAIDSPTTKAIEGEVADESTSAEGEASADATDKSDAATPESSEKQGAEADTADGNQTDGDKSKEKPDSAPATIKRPTTPPRVRPDSNGRITFAFNGQPWPDVLQWLATASGMSLDWQELPSDYLNLSTQRGYTMVEARDLVNRHLQQRGFVLLVEGEVLSVAKLDKLDPSLVPRATEDELYDAQPHTILKLTFELPESLDVAKAADDVKQLLSPHAKVLPLASTRRLLVIDNAANLRMVSEVLNSERLAGSGRVMPREFILQHARAERVIDIVYVVLGMDPAAQPSQMQLEIQQQKMQLLMQMQQSGADVARMVNPDNPPVYLAFNPQRNSILANAPAAQLKVIERTIELLDVPAAGTLAALPLGDDSTRQLEKYQLVTMDPNNLIRTLSEIGNLSPLADLRADSATKVLFARASRADHEQIASMIEQLDGPALAMEVYPLRKHPADAVAGTLRALFAEKQEDNDDSRRRYYWGYDDNEEQEKPPELRVDADIENNRLLVRGDAKQIAAVEQFLLKIGEAPQPDAAAGGVRVIDSLDAAASLKVLEQLRSEWPAMSNTPLLILGPTDEQPAGEADAEVPAGDTRPDDRKTSAERRSRFRLAVDGVVPSRDGQTTRRSPIVVKLAPDGRLVISGGDAGDLDRLEEFIAAAAPPATRFKVFELNNISAFSVWLNLKEVYEEEIKGDEGEKRWDWYTDSWVTPQTEKTSQLSRRKKLRIVYDTPTNTILVANASPAQLYEIEQLITAYDQPAPADSVKSRRTEPIKLQYAQAKVVAAALKEVYRDLLSTRDKEFDDEDKKGGGITKESTTVIRYGGGSSDDGDNAKKTAPVKVGFQGALSVGVDEIGNVLIVSAQDELFESIMNVVRVLDEEARPRTSVSVRALRSGVSAEALQKALAETLGTEWVGGRPKPTEGAANNSARGGPNDGQSTPESAASDNGPSGE